MKTLHRTAGGLGLLLIIVFWSSTVIVEIFGTTAQVAWVKEAIVYGLFLLIPSLMAAGLSGRALSPKQVKGLLARKQRRMKVVAALGLLILLPAALFLAWKAGAGQFDRCFYGAQTLELLAGAVNISLLSLNLRDGLRLRKGKGKGKGTGTGANKPSADAQSFWRAP
ncbi:hypothetical protein ACTL6U_09780 [Rhodovibrionaceae bacterium A322]